jgi:hypothetical protein
MQAAEIKQTKKMTRLKICTLTPQESHADLRRCKFTPKEKLQDHRQLSSDRQECPKQEKEPRSS